MPGEHTSPDGRVWLVTGAASGFGQAIARAALDNGDAVIAIDRDRSVQALADQHPGRAFSLPLDVRDPVAVRAAVGDAVSLLGRIDVVFNNAGYGHVGAAEELTDQELRDQLDVNLFGVINLTRAVLPYLRRQRSGVLVQMSSLNGVEGLAGGSYYAASKFGIEGFSESLADEVAPLGIAVMIVEPGPHRTRFLASTSARWAAPTPDYDGTVGAAREMLRKLDGRQPGDPARAADAILAAVQADPPPRRLPLGRMALDHIHAKLTEQLSELDEWADLAASSDFPKQADEDLLRSAYDAFNTGDVEAAAALMAPDVAWPDAETGGALHGRDEVRRHWRDQADAPRPRIDVERISLRADGRLAADVRLAVPGPDAGPGTTDRLVHLFTLDDGQIKRMEITPVRQPT
jgi:NAD(P)-dependent dehydrogenase (short-subunit alcohol dehydrogenase family)/ketosteroid isomerase-like protein